MRKLYMKLYREFYFKYLLKYRDIKELEDLTASNSMLNKEERESISFFIKVLRFKLIKKKLKKFGGMEYVREIHERYLKKIASKNEAKKS